ncbi:MAG: STAS domain-containing protein [Lachnospiraceae bacterium]|nr:STAS domain-containing protein [Lachnospiraceae bacterium]
MKAEQSDGKLVIHLEGRIDSNNASAIEQEIHDAVAGHEAAELVFDAEKLTYISSAGLRVLMKMAKRTVTVTRKRKVAAVREDAVTK